MSLVTPILYPVPAFDSKFDFVFKFNVVGGKQVVANKLVIKNNTDNKIVYSKKQDSFKYEHILSNSDLVNGTYYNAVITTFDKDGNESKPSNTIQFWCYSTPKIKFTNIPTGSIVSNSSFNFDFEYSQDEGEKINSYIVNLYDANKDIVATSKEQYVVNGTPPYTGSYLFAGLQDNTIYYIEVSGITVENTLIKSPLNEFIVRYIQPSAFSILETTNNCEEGYITIKSNATLIEGDSNPSPPTYIDSKEVDLTTEDTWVEYSEGFKISNNFLARLWFRKPNINKPLIKLSNALNQTITLYYRQGYKEEGVSPLQCYIDVEISIIDGINSYIYSDYIDILPDTEYYNVWLTKKDDIYQVDFAKKGV